MRRRRKRSASFSRMTSSPSTPPRRSARSSGFFGTDVDITLRERRVDTVRVVGDCTNICVLYTAADARNLGYAVEVVRDGVTSFDLEAHEDALRELEKTLGATLV